MAEDCNFSRFLQGKNNSLLVKSEIGRPKTSGMHLPNQSFSYGKPLNRGREDAKTVINSWQSHKRSQSKRANEKDFKRMNRSSITSGCRSSKDFLNHQRSNKILRQQMTPTRIKKERIITDEAVRGGAPIPPSTPIYGVIGNLYGRVAQEVTDAIYKEPNKTNRRISSYRKTRGQSLLVAFVREKFPKSQAPKQEFKINRFTRIGSRVKSYRELSNVN